MRTIVDLVAEANASADIGDAERLLATAADQAATHREWETILDGIPATASIAFTRVLVDRALASARTHQEIWSFRRVAEFQAHVLGDPDTARTTLREGERVLLTLATKGGALGFYWAVLAGAFKTALNDDGDALRLLHAGWTVAWREHDVENLGRLVNQWSQLIDPFEARARLTLVEEAAQGWGNLHGTIYWWHALGDADAGNRVRQTVLQTSTRFDDVIELVRYWNLYEKKSPGIEAALARAESLAMTASEWLELAQRAHFEGDDDVLCRRALDHAARVVGVDTAEMKSRVASAYLDWLEDKAAADRIGPRDVRPEDLRPTQTKLAGWSASPSDLLDWLRGRATPENLTRIAEADYADDVPQHLQALQSICSSGRMPLILPWHPREVVELTRWSTGNDVDHLERGLCCALLCIAGTDGDIANTAAPLIESCLALGEEASTSAERLLVWMYETGEADAGDRLVELFSLFVLRAARAPTDPRLALLLETIGEAPDARSLREWLAGSLRADLWTTLLATIVAPLARDHAELTSRLAAIGL
ncbi:MAG: hypothetical protein ABI183_00665 [Polyangiaceae bacterium]